MGFIAPAFLTLFAATQELCDTSAALPECLHCTLQTVRVSLGGLTLEVKLPTKTAQATIRRPNIRFTVLFQAQTFHSLALELVTILLDRIHQ